MNILEAWTAIRYFTAARYFRRWPNREALERWQEKRVIAHVQKIRLASPFYHEYWGDRLANDWRHFPLTDKARMMEHFDRLNTTGIKKAEAFKVALEAERSRDFSPMIGSITVGLSSGTSGNRGLFLVSPQERMAWAGTVLAKVLPAPIWAAHRFAFFLRANSNLYGSVQGGRLRFDYHDILDSMEVHVERLNRSRPTLLIAPPSVLRILADSLRKGALNISPQRIVSVAEVLDPLDRLYMEEAFQQPLHQVYQCTEGFLAATCSHGTLHLNEDIIAFQKERIEPDSGRFVPILTDFSRFAQPMIRYRLNDILLEKNTPCPCGSLLTAIEAVEGRCDDLFYLPSIHDGRLKPVFPDLISRAVIHSVPQAEAYRVIQIAPGQLEVALQLEPGTDRQEAKLAAAECFRALFRKCEVLMPGLTFVPYEYKPDGRKLRRMERRFEIEQEREITVV